MFRILVGLLIALLLPRALVAQEIDLPEGLGELTALAPKDKEKRKIPVDITGFLDSRIGVRLQDDPRQKDMSLGEARLQVGLEKAVDRVTFNLVSDFIYDPVADDHGVKLEQGRGFIDLREANLRFSPLDFMDVKLGRQILTWGTGDLVFINDLFPKDWNSFFIGRPDDYLKAPSDALKTAVFFGKYNLDVIYTPRFDADRYIDGRRISFFDPVGGGFRGRDDPLRVQRPDRWFRDDELALRLYRAFGAFEAALYYYNGFWKSPAGQQMTTGVATFPRLQVFGASLRGPVGPGIGYGEAGYYDSRDAGAANPMIRNSEFRFLAGYEQEIGRELTGGLQYYLEGREGGADRHLMTLRLTKLLMRQDMKLSLFNFYSPSDKDGHLRLNLSYKIRDNLKIEAGGNIFYGADRDSFFGQFQDASNLYSGLHLDF